MNAPSNKFVDHINRDTKDVRKRNLRLCSRAENLRNRRMFKNNQLSLKGIYFETDKNRFCAQVTLAGKKYRRRFKTVGDAIKARATMVQELHGEFASLN